MIRFPSWPERLAKYLQRQEHSPFRWGIRDCVLMAWSAVEAMTGVDLGLQWRGHYGTKEEAEQIISDYCGGGNLEAAVLKFHAAAGLELIPVLRAQRGDLVLIDTIYGPSLGIVGPLDACFPAASRGLAHYPLRACRRAWRVG